MPPPNIAIVASKGDAKNEQAKVSSEKTSVSKSLVQTTSQPSKRVRQRSVGTVSPFVNTVEVFRSSKLLEFPFSSLEGGKSIYEQFINSVRDKSYPSETRLERHHIKPLHAGGTNEPENLVRISIEDHAKAHLLRYMAYNEEGDLLAYKFRKGDTDEAFLRRSRLGLAARRAKN